MLKSKNCENCDLSEADLSYAILKKFNLSGADLRGSNLYRATLKKGKSDSRIHFLDNLTKKLENTKNKKCNQNQMTHTKIQQISNDSLHLLRFGRLKTDLKT